MSAGPSLGPSSSPPNSSSRNGSTPVGRGHAPLTRSIPKLKPKGDVDQCVCGTRFGFWKRKGHCYYCGNVKCPTCLGDNRLTLPQFGYFTPVAICTYCYPFIQMTRMSREQLGSLPTKQLQSYIKAYNLNAANLIEKSELIRLISGTELGETEERAFRSTAPSSPIADQGSSGEGRRREGSAPSRLERERPEGDWNRNRAQAREQQRRERERERAERDWVQRERARAREQEQRERERERRMREHEREARERERERREWARESERWREDNGSRYPGQNAVEAVENMFEGMFGGGRNSGRPNGGGWNSAEPFGPGFPFVPPGTIPHFPGSEFIPPFVSPTPHAPPPQHPFNAPQHPQQNPAQRPTPPPQPSGSQTTPPAEVPSLKALLQTNTDPSGLSAKTLKQILKNNKVEFGNVLEKSELVTRVKRLLDSEKAEMEKNGGDDEDGLCKICCDAPINCVFLECGHLVTCMECGKALERTSRECPICRERISRIVRTFNA